MSTVIQAPTSPAATAGGIRQAGTAQLEAALGAGRARLLALFAGFERSLGAQGLQIAFDPVLNLPLWELGHIGWFEEWWIRRNADRARGIRYDAGRPREASLLDGADACYDSARVPHAMRWRLALPDAPATRGYLAAVRDATFALLRRSGVGDDDLYFFRLVLLHEDMHREAWFMIAQQLGLDLGVAPPNPHRGPPGAIDEWRVPGGVRRIGGPAAGFAFDNELGAHEQLVETFGIDRAAITWRRYLPFVDAGGYDDERLWTHAGWQWRQRHSDGFPLHSRQVADEWQQRRFGRWGSLDPDSPAVHLSAHEAAAWCRFAGRRLPTELEWESAARLAADQREAFDWGGVWEWTASAFAPYPGFAPHPYREYSAPFFDGRPVLRGGSCATEPRLLHPAYRNYFAADRRDVFAGFRSCALR